MFNNRGLKIIFTGSIIFLGSMPAIARLGDIWTDFQFYANDLKTYLNNNVPDTLKPYQLQSQTAITNSNGALNIPNPNTAASSVNSLIVQYSMSNKYENNPAVFSMTAGNEIQRQITRGSVESVLGANGQSRLKSKFQDTQITVAKIGELANTAAINKKQKQIEIQAAADGIGNLVNQVASGANPLIGSMLGNQAVLTRLTWEGLSDLELQSINIQTEQSKIAGETLATMMLLHQDMQYSNLNLANISQQVDDINRSRRVDTSAEVGRLLRATSQTDLLGRKN